MRIVFDSNVVIAAFATRGLCQSLFEVCLQSHEIVVSAEILDEVERGLVKKLKVPKAMAGEIRRYLETHCRMNKPVSVPKDVCRDPSDLPILGVAVAARAQWLVSGDADLLTVKTYMETRIVNPRELYEILRRPRP